MSVISVPGKGVTVRMYRHGHGDCFLLAFPREGGGPPVHVLIDCGYKPGSQKFIHAKNIGEIVKHIEETTDKELDLVLVTHEHQDHVNGFWKKKDPYFKDFTIQKAWLAWTESPSDPLAKRLRKKHRDQLLRLVEARHKMSQLAADENSPEVKQLDEFLSTEFGGEDEGFNLNAMRSALRASSDNDPARSMNKQAMKLVKDKANENDGIEYLSPGTSLTVPGTEVMAYILGPPRREQLLKDEDPRDDEEFHLRSLSFGAALGMDGSKAASPFTRRYSISSGNALRQKYFDTHYGKGKEGQVVKDLSEVLNDASWRRIDGDWVQSAGNLALKLNTGINNTSLVVAFELPETKRVLLFAADAQRGSWISWDDKSFETDEGNVTARELLGRTVLYKSGHHGSHNATLNGEAEDDYPNLSWMGSEQYGEEFVAMITAVNRWAMEKNNPPWRHPLPAIRKALLEKAQGRVFQIDIDLPEKPAEVSEATWRRFLERASFNDLFFDYEILDE